MLKLPPPLTVKYDEHADTLTVDGVRYSGEFFRHFSIGQLHVTFKMVQREDGIVTVERVYQ